MTKDSWDNNCSGETYGGSIQEFRYNLDLYVGRKLEDAERFALTRALEKAFCEIHARTISLNPEHMVASQEEQRDLLDCFVDEAIYVELIPNGYCSEYCCRHLPWFRVTTRKGILELGWRKRVISLDWSATTIKQTGKELFPNRTMTLGDDYLHASGYEDLKNCIATLMQA